MSQKRQAERGTTLIESLMSMVVLTVGMLGLVAANNVVAFQNHAAAKRARAASVARDVMSCVAKWDFADPRLTNTFTSNDATVMSGGLVRTAAGAEDYDINLNTATQTFAKPMPAPAGYERFLNITPIDNSTGFRGKLVTVTVTWYESGRLRRSLSLSQAKYDPEGNRASVPGL